MALPIRYFTMYAVLVAGCVLTIAPLRAEASPESPPESPAQSPPTPVTPDAPLKSPPESPAQSPAQSPPTTVTPDAPLKSPPESPAQSPPTPVTPDAAEKLAPIPVKPGAPEGFETYGAPQDTVVDVHYGGLYIGSFRAVYTPKSIVFSQPEEIIAKIPSIKFEETQRVIKAITGELPTHADVICGRIPAEGCGKLTPDVAGIIFYEARFKAELFLSPAVLAEQDTHKDKILPPAPDVLSAVHALNGGFTGVVGEPRQHSLLASSIIAYGPQRVNLVGIASDELHQINTMTFSLDKWGLDNRIGYFDSRSAQLLAQVPMKGVSVGTSLNTNLVLRDAAGSRLTVFLPQRSYVSIMHNNVIYTTDFYEAGNQVLNTDTLPEGTYEVTLRIRDTNGLITEEKRFFAKNFSIPPTEHPIYYGQFGQIRDTTQTGHVLSLRGEGMLANIGTIRRVNETIGGSWNLQAVKDQMFSEAGVFVLLPPDHQFRASMLLSSARDMGYGLSYLGYMLDKKVSFAADMRTILSGKKTPDDVAPDPTDLITAGSKQMSGVGSYQLSEVASIALQGSYTRAGEGLANSYSYGPSLRYDLWRSDETNLTFTTDNLRTSDGMVSGFYLRFTMRLGQWGYSADATVRRGDAEAVGGSTMSRSGNGRVTWNGDQEPGRLTVVGAEARHDDTTDGFAADFDHRSDYGNVRFIGDQTRTLTSKTSSYAGNFGVSLVNADGRTTWGGNQQQGSGIIVRNTGNSVDVPMKVMIDNTERTVFSTGKSATLFVTPYQTYNVSIVPAESSAVDYDGNVKNVTLYPGNVLPMIWDINRVSVVLGHVLLPDGTPLTNAKLEEARNLSVTDEEGLFQGELLELKKITFSRTVREPELQPLRRDDDMFTTPPPHIPGKSKPSKLSAEEQSRIMTELFGEVLPSTPNASKPDVITDKVAESPAVPPAAEDKAVTADTEKKPTAAPAPVKSETAQAAAPAPAPAPSVKLQPAIRCEVILPETKEINGVYIYAEPLTCTPIPFEDKTHGGATAEEKQAYWSLYEQPVRVSSIMAPIFNAHEELAYAMLNIKPSHARNLKKGSPPDNSAETRFANAARNEEKQSAQPGTVIDEPITPGVMTTTVLTEAAGDVVMVQLGAFRSESEALAVWHVASGRFSELNDKKFHVLRSDLAEKGVYYRLRAGDFVSVQEAREFCRVLITKGQPCIVAIDRPSAGDKPVAPKRGLSVQLRKAPSTVLPVPVENGADPAEAKPTLYATIPPPAKLIPVQPTPSELPVALPVTVPTDTKARDASDERSVVQVGAFRSESEAMAMKDVLLKTFDALSDKKSFITKVNLGERGIYYRLRFGNFTTHGKAMAFCRMLYSRGQDCIVPVEETRRDTTPGDHHHAEESPVDGRGLGGPLLEWNGM